MTSRFMSLWRVVAALSVASAVVAGCGGSLGPPVPTGAIDIGGPSMPSAPPPPQGWALKEVVPQSHQQAQDTLVDYFKRTLAVLPAGTVLDAMGHPGSGKTAWCDDEPKDPKNVPVHLLVVGDIKVPGDMDPKSLITRVGDVWRSWGWYVFERDGFNTPNQFGYGPDGYRLQIEMASPPGYPPTLTAISPCFPGNLARDDLRFPMVVGGQ